MLFSNLNLNNFQCRYCAFNAQGKSEILFTHYQEVHPVSSAYQVSLSACVLTQNNEVIAYVSHVHEQCCIVNCPESRPGKIKKNLKCHQPSICIRLKYGGSYDALEKYFDGREYFEDEIGIFVCLNLFEFDEDYDTVKTWLLTYGLVGTFKMKKLTEQRNKNLIILKRTPKSTDRRVIVSKINCAVTPQQEILLAQKEELVKNQAVMVNQIEKEQKEKKRWRQIACARKRTINALRKEISGLKDSIVMSDFAIDDCESINEAKKIRLEQNPETEQLIVEQESEKPKNYCLKDSI